MNKLPNEAWEKFKAAEKQIIADLRQNKAVVKAAASDTYDAAESQSRLETNLKPKARAYGLARAFVKGTTYKVVESKRREEKEVNFKTYVLPAAVSDIAELTGRDDPAAILDEFVDWLEA